MGLLLSDAEIAAYRRDGYAFPFRVTSAEQAAFYRKALEAHEARLGGELPKELRHKPHQTVLVHG